MNVSLKRAPALLGAASVALGLAACGSTVSTAGFQGEEHKVAQALSSFQSDATAGDAHKICTSDLAKTVVARLNATELKSGSTTASTVAGCERAIKNQLIQVDNLEAKIEAVKVAPGGGSASATVKSIRYGKSTLESVSLLREGASWKISGP